MRSARCGSSRHCRPRGITRAHRSDDLPAGKHYQQHDRYREVYRGSKAALNQFMRSFAVRQAGTDRALLLMAPGWIKTALGGDDAPFTIGGRTSRRSSTSCLPSGSFPAWSTSTSAETPSHGDRTSTPIRPLTNAHRASRRARFFGRGAGVAVRARQAASPCRRGPMGRPAGRCEHGRHARRARTPDPGRSVRVPDQLRRWTISQGRDVDVARHALEQPQRGEVVLDRVSGVVQVEHRNQDIRKHVRRREPRAPQSTAPHGPGHALDAR